MKTIAYLIILLLSSLIAKGQTSDHEAIKQAVTYDMESHYASNTGQMQKAIHHEVAKRHIVEREGLPMAKNMGYTALVSLTKLDGKKWVKEKDQPLKVEVKILDIDGRIASIKASTNQYNFYDYMHLAKIDGQWKIINVLWDNRK